MAVRLLTTQTALSHPTKLFCFSSSKPISRTSSLSQWRSKGSVFTRKMVVKARVKVEEKNVKETSKKEWGKVSAVLFDMDGVLCNSENPSRKAAVDVFAEMGVQVTAEEFAPFTGMGEANFLGGVASIKGVKEFDTDAAKKRFFEIYLDKYAKPNSGIGFPGALELITECKNKGLKVAVASSADHVKVDANLAAAGLPLSMFDAIVSADAFENLKPAPDIFLAASKILDVFPDECIVIEDALAGVQASNAVKMRPRKYSPKTTFALACGGCLTIQYISFNWWMSNDPVYLFLLVDVERSSDRWMSNDPGSLSTDGCQTIQYFLQSAGGCRTIQQPMDVKRSRSIAVTTTITEETLKAAAPSIIRIDIGTISLDDILSGGSGGYSL